MWGRAFFQKGLTHMIPSTPSCAREMRCVGSATTVQPTLVCGLTFACVHGIMHAEGLAWQALGLRPERGRVPALLYGFAKMSVQAHIFASWYNTRSRSCHKCLPQRGRGRAKRWMRRSFMPPSGREGDHEVVEGASGNKSKKDIAAGG